MTAQILVVAAVTFIACLVLVPLVLGVLKLFGGYVIVGERRCLVYTLFGKVVAILDEPGMYCLWTKMGPAGLVINWLGKRYVLDLSVDQTYMRSQPVNSEEGAPMGIGVWYEMFVSDPVAYLFKNADPRGSLRANVSNAVVRTLSNLKLENMLENRHEMSQTVRAEVSPHSHEWGYKVGSVYIRKVHFRDHGMIRQIEEKVVNRLRQVTSAIRQDGANQVSIIRSTADREAAIEFAKAAALRPRIVGEALHHISADPEVAAVLFEILEIQRLLEGQARVTLLPKGNPLMAPMLASMGDAPTGGGPRRPPPSMPER
jgi:regulator of protease activity HflC (stomatin/prohibitin superfamily)